MLLFLLFNLIPIVVARVLALHARNLPPLSTMRTSLAPKLELEDCDGGRSLLDIIALCVLHAAASPGYLHCSDLCFLGRQQRCCCPRSLNPGSIARARSSRYQDTGEIARFQSPPQAIIPPSDAQDYILDVPSAASEAAVPCTWVASISTPFYDATTAPKSLVEGGVYVDSAVPPSGPVGTLMFRIIGSPELSRYAHGW